MKKNTLQSGRSRTFSQLYCSPQLALLSLYPKQILASIWYTDNVNKHGEPEGMRFAFLWIQLQLPFVLRTLRPGHTVDVVVVVVVVDTKFDRQQVQMLTANNCDITHVFHK